MGKKNEEYPAEKAEVMAFQARVEEAQRHARVQMKDMSEKKGHGKTARGKGKRGRDHMDEEEG